MSAPADIILTCLQHWADIARGMHSPTWTEWERQTREALHEYSRRTNGATNGAANGGSQDTVSSLASSRLPDSSITVEQGQEAGVG